MATMTLKTRTLAWLCALLAAGHSAAREPSDFIDAYQPGCGQVPRWRPTRRHEPCFSGCARSNASRLSPAGRISGGELAHAGQFPSFVLLLVSYGAQQARCGATLIDRHFALTAAHCVDVGPTGRRPDRIVAVFGPGGRDALAARTVSLYDDALRFAPTGAQFENDLAVLYWHEPVHYSDHLQPACLPYERTGSRRAQYWAIGMGLTERSLNADRLLYVPVERQCPAQHQQLADQLSSVDCFIAGAAVGGTCRGDSGSGILCVDQCGHRPRQFAVGQTVFGLVEACQARSLPNYAADYFKLRDVIVELIRGLDAYARRRPPTPQ